MASNYKSQDTAGQDWSKFDFTRWNLEGLNLDSAQASLAGWVRDLTVSPQWAEQMAAGVAAIQSAALPGLKDHATGLQTRLASLDAELADRVAATTDQFSALEEAFRAAAAPPDVASDPASMKVAAKVMDRANKLGLPGLQARLFDAQNPGVTLAGGTTDLHGNVVLQLTRQQIEDAGKTGAELTMEVLTPSNKPVFSGKVASAKLNQTETVIATAKASKELSQHLNLAKGVQAQNQALLGALTTQVDTLKAHYQQSRDDLQRQLDEVQSIIAELAPKKTSR